MAEVDGQDDHRGDGEEFGLPVLQGPVPEVGGDHVAGPADGVLELAEQLVVVGSGTGIIRHGWTDPAYIARPTVGFDALSNQVDPCTARWAVGLRDVPAAAIEAAAELLGTAYRLLSTVLQGV